MNWRMPRIEIFDGSEDAGVILQVLKHDGLVGICGGRLEVRKKLAIVEALIEEERLEGYWAQSTINHPETELGYAHDEVRYSIEEAQKYVTEAYDKKNSSQ